MTKAAADLVDTLSSVDSIKSFLAGLVGAASVNRDGQPVPLAYVGIEFAKTVGITFERHLASLAANRKISVSRSKLKLASFIEEHCADILSMSRNPAGLHLVSPGGPGSDGSARVDLPVQPPTLRFHRAIWAAFIRPLDGRRRFLNLSKVGFTDSAAVPPGDLWQEIEERFVLGAQPDAVIDGSDIQGRIERWAQASGVPLTKLVINNKPVVKSTDQLEQLIDIVTSLPASIAGNWSIPVAVIKHLRGSR